MRNRRGAADQADDETPRSRRTACAQRGRRRVGRAPAQPDAAEALRRVCRRQAGDPRPGQLRARTDVPVFWERCTFNGSICRPTPDLGDEHATTVRPHGRQGHDVGVRLGAGVTVDHGRTWMWSPLSPVIAAGGPPMLQRKGGIDPYTQPRVGMLLQPQSGGSPRSVRYAWQRCTPARCVDMADATRLDYRVHAADVGKRLRVVSTAAARPGAASASQTTKPVR
jgi:hypothetical protein